MNLVIKRGWTTTLEQLPDYSIALDGLVPGPKADPEHHRFSFDHHEGCLRYCTLASCEQAHASICLGLDPEQYTVYANDVDSDVCLAIWCLQNPDRCLDPLLRKLVEAVGLCDRYAGAFPYPSNGMLKTVEWISAPETDSKRNKDYYKLSEGGLLSILEAVLHRIDLYVNAEASIEIAKQCKYGQYKVLREENGWVLVESNDPHIYSTLYHAGFNKIVKTNALEDGSIDVSIAKRSDFVSGFSLPHIYSALNELEPGWGGSSTSGGAPRNSDGSRTRLGLQKITEVIDSVVK